VRRYRGRDGQENLWFEDGEIDDIVETELRKALLMPTEAMPVIDLERFIEGHLKVALDQYADLDAAVLGVTEFFSNRLPRISINKELTGSAVDEEDSPLGIRGRWRATLAHEAAHVMLHRCLYEGGDGTLSLFGEESEKVVPGARLHRCLKRDVSYGNVPDWREVQANRGMAALLMPRPLFARFAREHIDQLFHAETVPVGEEDRLAACLAPRFEVSRQAAGIRLRTLKLVSNPAQTEI
jgi:hypothetical protein